MQKPYYSLILRTWCCLVLILVVLGSALSVQAQNAIDLVLHYVEGQPSHGKLSYDMQAFVSVFDQTGTPIKGLKAADFTLTEDSKGVAVDSVSTAENEPISLVLALDSSGTMYTQGIEAARGAAWNFVSSLGMQDNVAIISFNDKITRELEPTNDHKAATDRLAMINAIPSSGTCLYDAAYTAAQMAATYPAGRRAVILLTDGKDELPNGKVCSTHTIEDVINLASNGNTRVPIYTIGVRDGSDEKGLKRIAEMTGGYYQYTPSLTQIGALFSRLADQLKSEYVLKYTSLAGPGAHSLIVQAATKNGTDQETRNFLLPALPTMISIVSPVNGQEVKGKIHIVASITSNEGEPVSQVVLQINGTNAGTKASTPYDFEWDFSSGATGAQVISVIAQGKDGKELAKAEATVNVIFDTLGAGQQPNIIPTTEPPAMPTAESTTASATTTTPSSNSTWLILGILAGVIIVAALVAFIVIRNKKNHLPVPVEEFKLRDVVRNDTSIEGTIDIFSPLISTKTAGSSPIITRLTVCSSDDPSTIDMVYIIEEVPARIGRGDDIEVPISKRDQAVSRLHALITQQGGQFYINELASIDVAGKSKRPPYGTFVNDQQIGSDPVPLLSGAMIRLGPRMSMKFESFSVPEQVEDDLTTDGMIVDPDATLNA